ncbi:MAG: FtsX-like permease family protein, partial [bacterium]|nr:FtsX-like permease family protein [bacterium]
IRKGLLVFQFAISIFMIFGTITTYNQMDYFRSKDLGFNKNKVVAVGLSGELSRNVVRNIDALRSELSAYHGIESISTSSKIPGTRFGMEAMIPENRIDDRENYDARFIRSDEEFLKTFDIEIVEGSDFKKITDARNNTAFLVNETFVDAYDLNDPIGVKCIEANTGISGEIVGVMKDFNYASLQNTIDPLVIVYRPQQAAFLMVKISGDDILGAIQYIQSKITEIAPDQLFTYSFVEDTWAELYRSEDIMSSIFRVFSLIAIVISCLGLFGLATYSAELRTKEMGVRKVLGASGSDIIASFAREFILWVIIANVIALPLALYVMRTWLENFAYRITIGLDTILISVLAALLVALISVSYQAVKTALANPVKSLRYE